MGPPPSLYIILEDSAGCQCFFYCESAQEYICGKSDYAENSAQAVKFFGYFEFLFRINSKGNGGYCQRELSILEIRPSFSVSNCLKPLGAIGMIALISI